MAPIVFPCHRLGRFGPRRILKTVSALKTDQLEPFQRTNPVFLPSDSMHKIRGLSGHPMDETPARRKNERMNIIQMATIREMGRLIGERFQARRVVLFGSYARGQADENSDVDLLVVMDSDAPWLERSVPIRKALSERWIEPVDVIVRSPRIFEEKKNQPYTLEHEAMKDGVVLYERN